MRRILIISHVYVAPEHRGKLRALAAPDLELQVRGLAAGSEAAAALLKRQAGDRAPPLPIAVIPQLGVHVPPAPEHQPHEGLAIGCVGRLVPAKGVDTLLEALAEIRSASWRLTIVGDGPDRERLEALASRLRLAARVRWTGALPPDHLTRLWPELDVLAVPLRRLPGGGGGGGGRPAPAWGGRRVMRVGWGSPPPAGC